MVSVRLFRKSASAGKSPPNQFRVQTNKAISSVAPKTLPNPKNSPLIKFIA